MGGCLATNSKVIKSKQLSGSNGKPISREVDLSEMGNKQNLLHRDSTLSNETPEVVNQNAVKVDPMPQKVEASPHVQRASHAK